METMKHLELCSAWAARTRTRAYIRELASKYKWKRVLEISPGRKPIFFREEHEHCKYADYFSTEDVVKNNTSHYKSNHKDGFISIDYSLKDDPELTEIENNSLNACASSHVIEHIPNPIKHLALLSSKLKPGGCYVLLIPDKMCNFDIFRQPSELSDWMHAYQTDSSRANPREFLNFKSKAALDNDFPGNKAAMHKQSIHNYYNQAICNTQFTCNIEEAYAEFVSYKEKIKQDSEYYNDFHIWTFTPASAHLLFLEAFMIGLSDLYPVQRSKTMGDEFAIILKKKDRSKLDNSSLEKDRFSICQEVFL